MYQPPTEPAAAAPGPVGSQRPIDSPPSVQFGTSINRVPPPAQAAPQAATIALPAKNRSATGLSFGIDLELTRPLFAVAAIGATAALVALVVYDRNTSAGVAIGAVLATLNLWAFARIGTAVLDRSGAKTPWILIAPLKLGLLFAAVVAVLKAQIAGPVDFLVGYLALPIGIVVAQLIGHRDEMGQEERPLR